MSNVINLVSLIGAYLSQLLLMVASADIYSLILTVFIICVCVRLIALFI